MIVPRWAAALLAVVLGAMSTLPHAQTEAWWLPPLLVAALAAAVWRAPPARAALLGWAFGTGWLVAGTWWLYISLHTYGGLAAPLAALAVVLLAAALALYLGVAMAWAAACRSGSLLRDTAVFTGVWLLAELARGVLFTGFPWAAAGYAQVDGPLAALAPWIGVYGIGAVVGLLGALIAWPLAPTGPQTAASRPTRWLAPVAALVLMAMAAAAPQGYSTSAGALRVSLVQTNVNQDDKFDTERMPEALQWLVEALSQAQGDLVVAPETAVPLLPDQLPHGFWAALQAPFEGSARAALVGLPLGSYEAGYTNSVIGFGGGARVVSGADSAAYRYDKHHLVPFGEFIPWGFRWFVNLMNIPLGDFNRGPVGAPSFEALGQRLAPNICYEDLFGEELARRFADPARAPTVMVNVSNIAWFGPTVAIDHHLHISRLRSLELERPMIRATNTGATVVIDHRGRVRHWLEPHTRGVLEGVVEGREGLTPYARWASMLGLWPLLGLGLLGAAAGLGRRARRGGAA
jgi:apolipoprotein N-acyltransferase